MYVYIHLYHRLLVNTLIHGHLFYHIYSYKIYLRNTIIQQMESDFVVVIKFHTTTHWFELNNLFISHHVVIFFTRFYRSRSLIDDSELFVSLNRF